MRTREIVEVTWHDTTHWKGWRRADEGEPSTSECRSVGYVVRRNRAIVALAQSWSEENNIADVLVIPRPMVRSIRRL